MTLEEFSNEFDTLINSYDNTSQFGITSSNIEFNEYEKSVFLTQAQEEIIKELYTGKNITQDSFEKTEEIRRYLGSLVKTSTRKDKLNDLKGITDTSIFYNLPDGLLFITYEQVKFDDTKLGCLNGTTAVVVPTTQDEYYKVSNNPFRGPNNLRVLRLDYDEQTVELISKYNIQEYTIRYMSKPSPIILIDLPDNLTINNESKATECSLNSILHRVILERAIKLALKSKITKSNNK